MKSPMLRIAALAVCLVAPLGWGATANAATTATVSITGQVVETSMSLTLSTSSIDFGDIDATGDAYDPAVSTADPFAIDSNPSSIPEGTAWFIHTPVTVTMCNPTAAFIATCLTAEANVTDGTGSRLYMGNGSPVIGGGDPWTYLADAELPNCADLDGPGFPFPPGADHDFDFFPTYLVRANDGTGSFSATIRFTMTAF